MGVHTPPLDAVEGDSSVIEPDRSLADMNLKLESEAQKTWCPHAKVYGGINRVLQPRDTSEFDEDTAMQTRCMGSVCSQWRWGDPGGTRYEVRSFQSDYPVPQGNLPPAEIEEGWTFTHWDTGSKGRPLPRYWARRAVEIILPRGLCGLAGEV